MIILVRYFKKNFLLLISLVGIISFLSCLISYINTSATNVAETNYYFNNFTYSLVFSDEHINEPNFYKDVIATIAKSKDVNLFNISMSSQVGTANGLYLTSTLNTVPQMKEGRFFTLEDFKDDTQKLAVVGASLSDNIVNINGKKTINLNGVNYDVIGIMGNEKLSNELNYKIFFNLNSLKNSQPNYVPNSGWVLSSKTSLSTTLPSIQDKLKNYKFIYSDSEKKSSPLSSAFSVYSNRIIYSLTIFISIFVNIFIIIFLWFDGIVREIGVRKCFGANNANIYFLILKKFIFNNIVATTISVCILKLLELLNIFSAEYYFHIYNLVAISLFILLLSILLLSILIKRINSISPNYILRGIK